MLLVHKENIDSESFKGLCSFSPLIQNSGMCIVPGIYCFVQFNTENKKIFLLPLANGTSAHTFLTKLILKFNPNTLKESDLLSAGELIIGEKNIVTAWCLKSGAYKDKLSLNCEELPKKTGLPVEARYSLEMWENYCKHWHATYLNANSKFKPNPDSLKNIYQSPSLKGDLSNCTNKQHS